MTIEKKARWIAGTLAGLLLLTFSASIHFYNTRENFKAEADRTRLAQDSVLAVKQLLEKELQEMRINLQSAKGRNAELDSKLAASESLIREKQQQIDKLLAANATVNTLRRQLQSLRLEKEAMNKKIQELVSENQRLQAENERLARNIAVLEKDNRELQDRLTAAAAAGQKAGNFRVEMVRKNTKVTAKAKRTKEIIVSFDLPAGMAAQPAGSSTLYLVVLDPKTKPVKNKTAEEIRLDDGELIIPIKSKAIDMSKNPQSVSIGVNLDGKVKTGGIYKVQVYTNAGLIGAAQIRMN